MLRAGGPLCELPEARAQQQAHGARASSSALLERSLLLRRAVLHGVHGVPARGAGWCRGGIRASGRAWLDVPGRRRQAEPAAAWREPRWGEGGSVTVLVLLRFAVTHLAACQDLVQVDP